MKHRELLMPIAAVLLILTVGFSLYVRHRLKSKPEWGLVAKSGNVIVRSLERYRNDNEKYPANLQQLIPKYLKEIPKAEVGERRWSYRLVRGDKYELYIQLGSESKHIYIYDSNINHWTFGTNR